MRKTLDQMQEEFNANKESRRTRKKGQFVIGPKFVTFGNRGRRAIGDGVEFKPTGRTKNKNPRYMAQLKLGAE